MGSGRSDPRASQGDRDDPRARIPLRRTVGRELLEDDIAPTDPGLLGELAVRGILEVLVDVDEAGLGGASAPAYGSSPRRTRSTCSSPERTLSTTRSQVTKNGGYSLV